MMQAFDDILFKPKKGILRTRDDADISSSLFYAHRMNTPFIAAPMASVCEAEMAVAIYSAGGFGFIHRFMSVEEGVKETKRIRTFFPHTFDNTPITEAGFALGVNEGYERLEKLYENKARIFCIDVAHGHSISVEEYLAGMDYHIKLRCKFLVGNIATSEGAQDLINWGADALRVGIGNGSACLTRKNTGVGIPQLQALNEVYSVALFHNTPVVSCGGIRSPGDVAKALSFGADTVMLGGLLAGCSEAPIPGYYRGASMSDTYSEGAELMVPLQGSVASLIQRFSEGLRSTISYIGGTKNKDLLHADYVSINTTGAYNESYVR